MSIEDLNAHSQAEVSEYHTKRASGSSYSYELFRRALQLQDQPAWSYLYVIYHAQMKRWVENVPAFFYCDPAEAEDLSQDAFLRFYQHFKHAPVEAFAQFPNLPCLLKYLQMCAFAAVVEHVNGQRRDGLGQTVSLPEASASEPQESKEDEAEVSLIDPTAENAIRCREFWQMIAPLLSPVETLALRGRYEYDLKPRDLAEMFGQYFRDAREVSNLLSNVIERLARQENLLETLHDFFRPDHGITSAGKKRRYHSA